MTLTVALLTLTADSANITLAGMMDNWGHKAIVVDIQGFAPHTTSGDDFVCASVITNDNVCVYMCMFVFVYDCPFTCFYLVHDVGVGCPRGFSVSGFCPFQCCLIVPSFVILYVCF
jgi:hypothetical protein